jgi:hypothetical protein
MSFIVSKKYSEINNMLPISATSYSIYPHAPPYPPLFKVLTGRFVEASREGFRADYAGAFLATQLVGVRPKGDCSTDSLGADAGLGNGLCL